MASVDDSVASVAAAIGEPARTRMLFCLMDGRARTSTELAVVAEVSPSTASVHLNRLKDERLVKMMVQGRHRYYSLQGARVARALEGLSILAGASRKPAFVPSTPDRLREARTCYDHMAGTVAVSLHDRVKTLGWIRSKGKTDSYELTPAGERSFAGLGIDPIALQSKRRRFAYACLDWSERRPHLGGALGAAVLELALRKRWVTRELDSRALAVTSVGRRALSKTFGVEI